jgi:hypothetical protein
VPAVAGLDKQLGQLGVWRGIARRRHQAQPGHAGHVAVDLGQKNRLDAGAGCELRGDLLGRGSQIVVGRVEARDLGGIGGHCAANANRHGRLLSVYGCPGMIDERMNGVICVNYATPAQSS